MKFTEFTLEATLQSGINKLGFTECTPIQVQAMGPILKGQDVAGLAQTGTGKTAAFLIPVLERLLRSRNVNADLSAYDEETQKLIQSRIFPDWKPQQFVLVLVPTRELADQVQQNLASLSVDAGIKSIAIYGGTGYDKQKEALRNGLDFIIATPGRLIDLYKEHLVDLKQVRAVIFDEADRMFDMGFKDDMIYILQRIPKERQFLVFSATLNFDVLNTAYQFGADPVELNVSRDQAKADNVKDQIFHVGHDEKPQHLLSLLQAKKPKQTIIFSNFKHNVDRIAQFLIDNKISAMGISSLLTQVQRTKVMQQFKEENEHNILVATDVAARGLDIQGVDMVINYELPNDSESYVHRIGRTGRAGATGQAFSLVCDRDIDSLNRIEDYLKYKIEVGFLEDAELIKDFKPFPSGDSAAASFGRDRGPRPQRPRGNDRRPSNGGGSSGGRSASSHQDNKDQHKGPYKPRVAGAASNSGPASSRKPFEKSAQGKQGPHPRHGKSNEGAKHPPRKFNQQKTSHPHKFSKQKATPAAVQKSAAQKSMGQKVVGFFKRLFGS